MRRLLIIAFLAATPFAYAATLEFARATEPIFAEPHDLVLDAAGKRLFVADMMHNTVKVLDARTLALIGELGKDELSLPHDVAFDRQGKLLVADTGNDRIAVYELDGARANRIAELHDGIQSPEGVDTDKNGRVVVSNTGEHTVVLLEHGRVIKKVGREGRGAGEFIQPHDVEFGPDGRIYVADPGNNRIQILSPELAVAGQIVGEGLPFNRPKYFGFDERGRLYVADQHNNMVRVLDSSFRQIAAITQGGGKKLDRIEGVYVRGDSVWIADTYNNRVVLFQWK